MRQWCARRPSVDAQAGIVRDTAPSDHRWDVLSPDETAVFVVVVSAVAENGVQPPSLPPDHRL